MRHFALASLMVLGLAFAGTPTTMAAPLGADAGNSAVRGPAVIHVGDGHCSYLRYKCEHKDEIGEWGQGNCRRYKAECGRVSYCERLRRACRDKYERGEIGMGNCRRYKDECGGRY
jgi:hypothetical protein